MGLFQRGDFIFTSGARSPIKFEFDKATDEDIEFFALIGAHQVGYFGKVVPVPKGKSGSPIDNAKRLAHAMHKYIRDCGVALIVDDVWTTGKSMEACRIENMRPHPFQPIGWVAFAYERPASWVTAGFVMSPTVGLLSRAIL